jgi:Putative Actinobacterial Holin-X, holin superfamily III
MSQANQEPSLGTLLGDLAQKTGSLVRQEVQLAKTEITAQAVSAGRDAGYIGAGGALAHAGLLSVIAAVVVALGHFIAIWLAALLVGLVVIGVGYGLIQAGRHSLSRLKTAPRTLETLRDDKAFLQEQIR